MPIAKTCAHCAKAFSVRPAKRHQRYCSAECRDAARSVTGQKQCEQCGNTFEITRKREATRRFCSLECTRAYEQAHGRPAARVERKETTWVTCRQCGKPFPMKPGYLTEYRRKYGKDPMYCSIPCSAQGRRADTAARSTFICQECGKENPMKRYEGETRTVYYRQQRFCDQVCKVAWQMRQAAARFESGDIGRHVKRHGYVWISIPANLAGGKKKEMLEHRWVMQQSLGRELMPEETVHHIDGNRQNNTIANLELFSSRHGPGQRVIDKVTFAIDILRLYPDFARRAGVELRDISPSD